MYKITAESTVIGRGQQADIQVIDEGISRRHAEIVHEGGQIVIRDLGSTNGTYCNGDKIGEHQLSDGDKIQVGSTTILKFTFHDSLDESFQRQMYESALRDGLTKIFNKKYFLDRLESEFAYAVRHRTPLSLVMFDIDHFKRINDTHGHLAGDYALSTLAKIVRRHDPPGGRLRALRRRGVRGHLPRHRPRPARWRSASASVAASTGSRSSTTASTSRSPSRSAWRRCPRSA